MKKVFISLILLLMSVSLYGQSITIDEDGIVRCKDVPIGTTQTVSGDTYEVVDRPLLIQRRDEGADLTKACVSNVTDMRLMFFNSQFNQPIGNWDVSSVTNMYMMFRDTNFNQPIGNWDVSSVTNMSAMFWGAFFNQNIGEWNVEKVLNMKYMFFNSQFNQPIGNWDVSSVKDMSSMFRRSSFNQPLDQWDVSSVIDMSYMFRDSRFNNTIGMWNVGLVNNMKYMFYNSFYNNPLENWNVSSVVDMSYMFRGSRFNQPIGSWDVSSVVNMIQMFYFSQFNQSIGSWDVSSVVNMIQMFYFSQFNQSITFWCVENILTEPVDFATNSPLISVNKPNWGTCTVPETPTQFYPHNNSTNVSRVLQFSWSKDILSDKYQLQVTEGGTTVIDMLVNDTTFTNLNALQENVEFSWRVRGFNQSFKRYGDWSKVSNFTTGLFQNITLLLPRNDSTGVGLSPIHTWNKEPNSQSYNIQVSTDEFATTIADEVVTDTSFTSPELSYSTAYQWRVRGTNTSGDGEWSTVWSFTTHEEPLQTPEQQSPFAGQENVGTMVEFQWASVHSVVSYHLQIAADETFSSLSFESSEIDTNTFTLSQSLDQNSSYFWRVRSLSDIEARHSSWSDTLTFTTGVRTSLEEDILPTEFSLNQNYPNPFNPTTQIQFSLPTTTNVRLEVYSITGQRISTLVDGSMGIGNHTVSFDGKSLSSGVYIYRLITPEFSKTRFMSLIK